MIKVRYMAAVAVLSAASLAAIDAHAVTLSFVGSDSDMLNQLPAATPVFVVVPWRSESKTKLYDIDGNNVYGSDGYAMFATKFQWYPRQGCCGGTVPFDSPTYPNLISLPSYVTGSLNLTQNKVGDWIYSLIDDPQLVNGYRDYNWGMTQDPPRPGPDQSPYVRLGILDGNDVFGNNPKTSAIGAGRWAFTVGEGVPNRLRIGVMTDGLDSPDWAATQVLLHQIGAGNSIIGTATTSTLVRNRYVDIHTFDIVGAQPGDSFAIFAKGPAAPFQGNGGISGVTFDAVPEPASVGLVAGLLAIGGLVTRVIRRS